MIFKNSTIWQLWGGEGVHPADIGCVHDGRDQCSCKYHVVDKDRTEVFSFENWEEAEEKYCELSGEKKFIFGKTDFNGNLLNPNPTLP